MDPTNGCGLSLFAHGCSLSASSVLLITAHPDAIKNCTGVILRCLELGAQVFEVLVTKGENLHYRRTDSREDVVEMRKKRQKELLRFISAVGME